MTTSCAITRWSSKGLCEIAATLSLGNNSQGRPSNLSRLRYMCVVECKKIKSSLSLQAESIRRPQNSMSI